MVAQSRICQSCDIGRIRQFKQICVDGLKGFHFLIILDERQALIIQF